MSSVTTRAIRPAVLTVVSGVATHPEDDLVLATAVSGNANYLVTGDRQLRKLGGFRGVTILTPREFLGVLRAQPDVGEATPEAP